jgi:SAM-dependent methyltransferase
MASLNHIPPHPWTQKYCSGTGMELGRASHNSFGLDCPNVAPCDGINFLHPKDLEDYQVYCAEQQRHGCMPTPVDLIGDFQNIPAKNNSLDYLVSSHVIEHEPNPIAAFIESWRALKSDGIFFCIFPKRNAEKNHDVFCPLGKLEDFSLAYAENRNIEDAFAQGKPWRCHMFVYSLQSMMQLINWINQKKLAAFCIEALEETDSKVGNGHTLILRKLPPEEMIEADYALLIDTVIAKNAYQDALRLAKIALSFHFFDADMLYAAALLSLHVGDIVEGQEFYRQSLIQNPEIEARRREFFEFFGEYYQNPVL